MREKIISARGREAIANVAAGVDLYTFVSEACGAKHFSTGLAKITPGAHLPYHTHGFSEAFTVLEGNAHVLVEGRRYRLHPQDCIHVPGGIAHQVENEDPLRELVAHWAFATAKPTRELTDRSFPVEDRDLGNPSERDPETIVRFDHLACYELSKNAFFLDLFARRLGSVGICGGYGRFLPGASLPCHIHDFDESITIVKGSATCLVEGKQYKLSGCDTAFIPTGLPHRFLNDSEDKMAMVWVYAGSEPDRRMVRSGYCSGLIAWPGVDLAEEEGA
jgi:quercetin dioxygenase-like cupin family protein